VPRDSAGRANQRSRTRRDLLEAALCLSREGKRPTLEEIAEEARVSRATAYRYFASVDVLLAEASLHVAFPDAAQLFEDSPASDPLERMLRADAAVTEMVRQNEASIRVMLASSVQQAPSVKDVPARQNRRMPLIEAALKPADDQFAPADLSKLKLALSLVVGTESMVVLKDVLRLSDEDADEVRRWAIAALVEAARKKS
jgi:AcrR family transcriptional regulator